MTAQKPAGEVAVQAKEATQVSGKQAMPKGRPFAPGRSGNPGGQPRIVRDVAAAAREHTAEAIATLARALGEETAPWAARIKAAEVLLNRGYGQAPQTINLAGNVSTLNHEQLERAIASHLAEIVAGQHDAGISRADVGEVSTPVAIQSDGLVH